MVYVQSTSSVFNYTQISLAMHVRYKKNAFLNVLVSAVLLHIAFRISH